MNEHSPPVNADRDDQPSPAPPEAIPPYELVDLKFSGPEKWAAGIPAVYHSFKQLYEDKSMVRGFKALLKMNQRGGFDCPSCAWPDPDGHRSALGDYCENGAKALAEEATSLTLTREFFREHSVQELSTWSDHKIGQLGRLAEPMHIPPGATHYVPISWDDAFALIAHHLNALDSPDEAAFYTSGRTSNEASFVYQLFVRAFGTNNFPDCSNMCHETSGFALMESLGVGKGTVTLEDFYDTDLIIIIGHNPGTNAPRMMSALAKGKQKGAKIIAINPLPEAGLMGFRDPQSLLGMVKSAPLADQYLPVKINGDMALLKALGLLLLEREAKAPGTVLHHAFIANKTSGFEEYKAQFAGLKLANLAREAGVSEEELHRAADLVTAKKRIIVAWGMGLTQQHNGVAMLQEIINLLLMKGSIGIQGGGVCPVRGHSNVQGNRTMLINNHPTQPQLDKLQEVFGFDPPRAHGYDVVDCIKAMHAGQVKVHFSMGGNFLSAVPDTAYSAQALRKQRLTALVSIKLNRSHLVHGQEALILPTLARSDKDIVQGEVQFISSENSMGVVQSSTGMLDPVSKHLINETAIVCRMAKAVLGAGSPVNWDRYLDHYDNVRDDIAKVIPGFEDYNTQVRQPSGFYLPNAARDGKFKTSAGDRARFITSPLPDNRLREGEYLMATTRTHDQFNTVVYGLDDRYRGIHNERRVVLMNAKDIAREGLKPYDRVDLFNHDDGKQRIAPLFIVVPYPIPERCTVTYFPETNVLVSINNVVADSNMPASKYVRITMKPHDPGIFARIMKGIHEA